MLSVATFSGIGIAAITGQLAVSAENGELFTSSNELEQRKSATRSAPAPVVRPTHVGLTRSAMRNSDEATKPMMYRVSQRFSETLAPRCSRCGVVDSIERHELRMPASAQPEPSGFTLAATRAGEMNSFAPSALTGANRSVYADETNKGGSATSFIVRLRMEDGSLRTIYEHQQPQFSVGEKVKLVNGSVVSLG